MSWLRVGIVIAGFVAMPPGAVAAPPESVAAPPGSVTIRVATFNIEDVRTADLRDGSSPRVKRLAEVIQRLRPNVILLNEIAYDTPEANAALAKSNEPNAKGGDQSPSAERGSDQPTPVEGQNATRFVEHYLAVAQTDGLSPLRMRAFMAPVNTGLSSGFDLDNDGTITTTYMPPSTTPSDGPPPSPDDAGRKYGNDCWGFGTFPGQYGMALLVDERLSIVEEGVRTFRLMPWDYMPGAFIPTGPDGTSEWFTPEEKSKFRLSSKSHWDVPVRLPNGGVVHFLCSHPTPPAFDGPEQRNRRRNHDEIRFWADYIQGQPYIVDDADKGGGLPRGSSFIIVGDLNADPTRGNRFKDPIGTVLASVDRVNMSVVSRSEMTVTGLAPEDTASFKLRVDYVLPSMDLGVVRSGVWRDAPVARGGQKEFPSDHYPVWVDVVVEAKK